MLESVIDVKRLESQCPYCRGARGDIMPALGNTTLLILCALLLGGGLAVGGDTLDNDRNSRGDLNTTTPFHLDWFILQHLAYIAMMAVVFFGRLSRFCADLAMPYGSERTLIFLAGVLITGLPWIAISVLPA